MERVIVYIDGFNLYFGLKSKGWKRYLWLNLRELSLQLLKPQQGLICTKYFTSKITKNPPKEKRQKIFLEALETLPDFEIYYGKYQLNPRQCSYCRAIDQVPNEKMTDVNIAVEMLADSFQNMFDVALLISADGDLAPAILAIRRLFPDKRNVACFPPDRDSFEIRECVNAYFRIGQRKFAHSCFPDEVARRDGYILARPINWK